MSDRGQIRREAEDVAEWNTGQAGDLAKHCLALLAELEQAERERDDEGVMHVENVVALQEKLDAAEARLAAVPALVEALKRISNAGRVHYGISGYEAEAEPQQIGLLFSEIAEHALAAYEAAQ